MAPKKIVASAPKSTKTPLGTAKKPLKITTTPPKSGIVPTKTNNKAPPKSTKISSGETNKPSKAETSKEGSKRPAGITNRPVKDAKGKTRKMAQTNR